MAGKDHVSTPNANGIELFTPKTRKAVDAEEQGPSAHMAVINAGPVDERWKLAEMEEMAPKVALSQRTSNSKYVVAFAGKVNRVALFHSVHEKDKELATPAKYDGAERVAVE